jgi:hypothetical protein
MTSVAIWFNLILCFLSELHMQQCPYIVVIVLVVLLQLAHDTGGNLKLNPHILVFKHQMLIFSVRFTCATCWKLIFYLIF